MTSPATLPGGLLIEEPLVLLDSGLDTVAGGGCFGCPDVFDVVGLLSDVIFFSELGEDSGFGKIAVMTAQ